MLTRTTGTGTTTSTLRRLEKHNLKAGRLVTFLFWPCFTVQIIMTTCFFLCKRVAAMWWKLLNRTLAKNQSLSENEQVIPLENHGLLFGKILLASFKKKIFSYEGSEENAYLDVQVPWGQRLLPAEDLLEVSRQHVHHRAPSCRQVCSSNFNQYFFFFLFIY